MNSPKLTKDIFTYADVRSILLASFTDAADQCDSDSTMIYELRSNIVAVKNTEDFEDLYDYYRRVEDSADYEYVFWLKDYGIINFDTDWRDWFKNNIAHPPDRQNVHKSRWSFYKEFISNLERQLVQKFNNFDDNEMDILDI